MSKNSIARSVFKISHGHEEPFSETEGMKLTSGKFHMTYSGEIDGEGVLMELKHYSSKDTATVYGLERISGRIHSKQGSFILEHVGKFENGILRSRRTVVPGSGTGDLINLRGEINFDTGPNHEFSFVLKYYFE